MKGGCLGHEAGHLKGKPVMNATTFLSSEQIARIWTMFLPGTIRELAAKGKLPVVVWLGKEPIFARDEQMIRAIRRIAHVNTK
jgi:hypothetical protein